MGYDDRDLLKVKIGFTRAVHALNTQEAIMSSQATNQAKRCWQSALAGLPFFFPNFATCFLFSPEKNYVFLVSVRKILANTTFVFNGYTNDRLLIVIWNTFAARPASYRNVFHKRVYFFAVLHSIRPSVDTIRSGRLSAWLVIVRMFQRKAPHQKTTGEYHFEFYLPSHSDIHSVSIIEACRFSVDCLIVGINVVIFLLLFSSARLIHSSRLLFGDIAKDPQKRDPKAIPSPPDKKQDNSKKQGDDEDGKSMQSVVFLYSLSIVCVVDWSIDCNEWFVSFLFSDDKQNIVPRAVAWVFGTYLAVRFIVPLSLGCSDDGGCQACHRIYTCDLQMCLPLGR